MVGRRYSGVDLVVQCLKDLVGATATETGADVWGGDQQPRLSFPLQLWLLRLSFSCTESLQFAVDSGVRASLSSAPGIQLQIQAAQEPSRCEPWDPEDQLLTAFEGLRTLARFRGS